MDVRGAMLFSVKGNVLVFACFGASALQIVLMSIYLQAVTWQLSTSLLQRASAHS